MPHVRCPATCCPAGASCRPAEPLGIGAACFGFSEAGDAKSAPFPKSWLPHRRRNQRIAEKGPDMAVEKVDALVVGAGQAGIAMSEHLSRCGVPHLVVERDRIAERWRSGRWDSLVANGPAWHDRFPGLDLRRRFRKPSFPRRRWPTISSPTPRRSARLSAAGSRCRRRGASADGPGFRVETSAGVIEAGSWSSPPGPSSARSSRGSFPRTPGSSSFTPPTIATPRSCPQGAVLVVGAGASGAQIADELLARRPAGLPLGRAARPAAAALSRARQRLVARGAQQVGHGGAADDAARHLRGERRPWRRRPSTSGASRNGG